MAHACIFKCFVCCFEWNESFCELFRMKWIVLNEIKRARGVPPTLRKTWFWHFLALRFLLCGKKCFGVSYVQKNIGSAFPMVKKTSVRRFLWSKKHRFGVSYGQKKNTSAQRAAHAIYDMSTRARNNTNTGQAFVFFHHTLIWIYIWNCMLHRLNVTDTYGFEFVCIIRSCKNIWLWLYGIISNNFAWMYF